MKYGYFCEDTAIEDFIDAVLTIFKKGKLQKHEGFFNKIEIAVENNDATIDRGYEEVSRVARELGLLSLAEITTKNPCNHMKGLLSRKKTN